MSTDLHKSVEQVALSLLLENAYEDFEHNLFSVGTRFLLWGSFDSESMLLGNYFKSKKKPELNDQRRSDRNLSREDYQLKVQASLAASEAWKYYEWSNKNNRQPILRDCLISYCSAFENCLKNVALVFKLAKSKKFGIEDQVFVPGDQFTKALKDINSEWEHAGDDKKFRQRVFYDTYVCELNPIQRKYSFLKSDIKNQSEWETYEVAVKLRNAVIHQLGRCVTQECIDGHIFPAMQEIELNGRDLEKISTAIKKIMEPLCFELNQL